MSRRNERWLEFLSQFTFEMRHVPGEKNVADHLSRVHQGDDVGQLASFISVFDKAALFDEIRRAQ